MPCPTTNRQYLNLLPNQLAILLKNQLTAITRHPYLRHSDTNMCRRAASTIDQLLPYKLYTDPPAPWLEADAANSNRIKF